jgi:glucose/arabinose dehydrogenase
VKSDLNGGNQMKKTFVFLTILALMLAVLTGCGCRNSKPAATTAPTTMPTTMPTTAPTTESTTVPTTMATVPTTDATLPDGNGPLTTEETNADTRMIPDGSGITGSITG